MTSFWNFLVDNREWIFSGIGVVILSSVAMVPRLLAARRRYPYIGPVFYGKDYFVTAVHEYIPSNNDSGYKQIPHDRPEQWRKLIEIKSQFFGLRHRVVPRNPLDKLVVVIRPTEKSGEKHIRFNR